MLKIVLTFFLAVLFALPLQAQTASDGIVPAAEALAVQIAKAEKGDVAAITQLADSYKTGSFGKADPVQALFWYEKGAALDDINSAYMAGMLRRERAQPGDHERAIGYFQQTIRLCERNGSSCTMRYVWREFARVYLEMANYREALKLTRLALAEAQQTAPPDEAMIALLFEDLGILHYSLGQYQTALENYRAAEPVYLKLYGAESETAANLLVNQGNAMERLGQYREAVAVEERALAAMLKSLGPDHQMIGILYNNIGWSLKGMGEYVDAYAALEKSLPILRRSFGANSDKVTYALTNMGIVREKQGFFTEAIALNMRALVIMRRLGPIAAEPMRWTLESLANSYKALGDRKTAILFAKLAVNTQQQIRARNVGLDASDAETLARDWTRLYQSLADLLIDEGRISEAQYVLDLLKQQELIAFVRRDETADSAKGTATLTKGEQDVESKLSAAMQRPLAIAAEIDALTAKRDNGQATPGDVARLQELNAALDQSYESFVTSVEGLLKESETETDAIRGEVEALNIEYAADRQDMLRNFKRRTVLLQAASMTDSLNLFLTTRDLSIHRKVTLGRADLSRKVFEVLAAIEARDPRSDALLAELYGFLIKPVEQDLKDSGAEVVMLNLGGFLRYLPFAALRSDHGYLIEDYALVLDTPAAQTRFETVDRKGAAAAGFGVTAEHAGFVALPGVATELEAIFQGADDKGELAGSPQLDGAFTEDTLKDALKKRPKLVHVASHFKFVPGNETDSFLLLGNGDALTLAQIRKGRGFRFGGVDLLTLSACETARGGDGEGDEVESFGAIAQMNGASAVMATLWPIADESSGRLMSDFYAGLVNDGLDKADALRRAQIAMLRGIPAKDIKLTTRGATDAETPVEATPATAPVTTRHPYFWSPYILMGNWL